MGSTPEPVDLDVFGTPVVIDFLAEQHALFVLLGAALAEAQTAEAHANMLVQLLTTEELPERETLGQKAKRFKSALPAGLADRYSSLVRERNYLVHELLFDFGGWSGDPVIDSPELYANLFGAIDRVRTVFREVTNAVTEHLVESGHPIVTVRFGEDGGAEVYDGQVRSWLPITSLDHSDDQQSNSP